MPFIRMLISLAFLAIMLYVAYQLYLISLAFLAIMLYVAYQLYLISYNGVNPFR